MPRKSQYAKNLLSGKAGECLSGMPYLDHSPNGEYATELSEVYDWMREQEEVMHWLMMKAVAAGKIKYDPFAEKWHGTGSETYE